MSKTVANLQTGSFHLAVIRVGNTAVPILDGEIKSLKGQNVLHDLPNEGEKRPYGSDTVVLLYQRTEESNIIM